MNMSSNGLMATAAGPTQASPATNPMPAAKGQKEEARRGRKADVPQDCPDSQKEPEASMTVRGRT